MAERVHRHQRRHPDRVAVVVAVDAAGQRRARRGLGGDDPRLAAGAQEGEHEAGEVRAAADAADHHVGDRLRQLELGDRLLPDHGLVQQHVVEHRAERVVALRVLGSDLDRLGDRDAERAGRVVGLRAAGLGEVARRAVHGRAPRLHHRAPVGLLVVARADHPDLALEPEQRARERERRPPLARAGLGRELLDPGLGVLVGLRDRRVDLVRAGRGDALVLVEDARGGVERLLEPVRAVQRRRAPQAVGVANGVGDRDLGLHRDLLADQAHREDRRQVVGPGGLARARAQRRQRRPREVGQEVDPVGRDRVLAQQELRRRRRHAADSRAFRRGPGREC